MSQQADIVITITSTQRGGGASTTARLLAQRLKALGDVVTLCEERHTPNISGKRGYVVHDCFDLKPTVFQSLTPRSVTIRVEGHHANSN